MPLTDTIVEKPKVGPVKAPGSLVVSLTKVRDKAGSEDCRRSEATAHLTLSRSSSDTEKTINHQNVSQPYCALHGLACVRKHSARERRHEEWRSEPLLYLKSSKSHSARARCGLLGESPIHARALGTHQPKPTTGSSHLFHVPDTQYKRSRARRKPHRAQTRREKSAIRPDWPLRHHV